MKHDPLKPKPPAVASAAPSAAAPLSNLSRRERQIMEIVYSRGSVSALQVLEKLPDPPSYSAVRAALSLLEKKGLIRHARRGLKYFFEPTVSAGDARVPALRRLLETFFNNSAASVVATLLDGEALRVSDEELDRLEKMIRSARKSRQ
ncbi:MAG: BlaI/MecI/CopY family transcriptional regulator [Chthoniobacter sp.]